MLYEIHTASTRVTDNLKHNSYRTHNLLNRFLTVKKIFKNAKTKAGHLLT